MADGITIVNLTGHALRLGYSAEMLPPAGQARVRGDMTEVGRVYVEGPPPAELPILSVVEGSIRDLPSAKEGVLYVVSGIVASAAMRDDVVSPGRVERGPDGRARTCHAFIRPQRMEKN